MNRIYNLIGMITLIIILLPAVNATQISLIPAKIDIPNMVQGGYYETEFLLNVNSQEDTLVKMNLDESPINNWIKFEPEEKSFYVSENNPKIIKMIIEPGNDVANGNYKGAIRFSVKSDKKPEGETSVVIEPGLVSKLNITITSNRVTDCRVINTKIENVEVFNPLNLNISVYNNGNIDAKPEIEYTITNKEKKKEITGLKNNVVVKPTQRKTITKEIEQSLKPGQYFINIKVPNCQNYNKSLTFDILKWGSISSQLTFSSLYPENVWNNAEDKIKIHALAKNTGTQLIKEAQFVGTIELDGDIVKVIATKYRQIIPGEEIAFEIDFNPKKAGKYYIKGTMQYDGKETFEKTTPINVNPKEKTEGITTENILLFLAIAIVVALLLITYIRKKR